MIQAGKLIVLAFIASLTTIILPIIFDIGSDVITHYNLIECFSEQFWAGDVYSRWCTSANAGLGSPYLISYYPLSYYIAAVFWPLHGLGVTTSQLYIFLIWLCGFVTFLTAWHWLKEICGVKNALICAFIYLWLPYRMEVSIFRASYPEMWLLAWVPLLFLYTRHFIQNKKNAALWLALVVALSLLTQVPTTLCVLFICGVYIMMRSYRDVKKIAHFGGIMAFAGALVAFYIVPGAHFQQYLGSKMAYALTNIWVCRHVLLSDFSERFFVMINLIVTCLLVLIFSLRWIIYRKQIVGSSVRGEAFVIPACALLAGFMLLPASAPLWDVWRLLHIPAMPWRMHAVVAAILVYVIAVNMHHLSHISGFRLKRADYGVLIGFLMVMSLPLTYFYTPELYALYDRLRSAKAIQFAEHFPKWTTDKTQSLEYIVEVSEKLGDAPLARILNGDGAIKRAEWNNAGTEFTLVADIKKPSTITFEHYYFPIWDAKNQEGNVQELTPDADGKMTIAIDTGKQTITLTRNIYKGTWLLEWCRQISFAAILFWAVLFWRSRRANVSTT